MIAFVVFFVILALVILGPGIFWLLWVLELWAQERRWEQHAKRFAPKETKSTQVLQ